MALLSYHLIIDDRAVNRKILKKLWPSGVQVVDVASLDSARDKIQDLGPPLSILADLRLGSVSPVETIEAVAGMTDGPRLAYTAGEIDDTIIKAAKDYGVPAVPLEQMMALLHHVRASWQISGLERRMTEEEFAKRFDEMMLKRAKDGLWKIFWMSVCAVAAAFGASLLSGIKGPFAGIGAALGKALSWSGR